MMSSEWQFLITLNERLRPLRDPAQILEVAVRLIGEHLHASRVGYVRIEGDQFVVIQSHAVGVPPRSSQNSVARLGKTIIEALRAGETVVVNAVESDARFLDAERGQLLADNIASFVAVPLVKDRRWVATFGVQNNTPRGWTPDQIALIELTAERTWAMSERARAEEALTRSESRQAFLRRLSDAIRPLAEPSRILGEACRLLGTYLRVNRVSYGQIDGDYCTVSSDYVDGVPSQAGRFRWLDLGGSRTADILKGHTLAVNDTSTESHTAEERAALQAEDIGAYICPLLVKDGRFVASFGIHNRTARVWTPDEISLAEEVADRIWATLEHRNAEAELRANERRLAFLLKLDDALRQLSDPGAVQERAARLLGVQMGVTRVGYAEFVGREYVIRREYTNGVPPLAGRPAGISLGTECRDAMRRGETVVIPDIETDPRLTEENRATLRPRQIAALIGVTLFKNGEMVAAFGANHAKPRVWTATEVELVRDVASRTWDAVERTRAEAALREQGHRLRLALDASAGGSWTWVAATNQVDWDQRFRSLYGFTPDEPANGDAWLPRVHEDDRPRMRKVLEEMFQSTTMNSWETTFRIVRPDGTVAWVQSRGRAERDADGGLLRLTGLDLDFNQVHRAEEALQARRDEEHDRALRTLLETATQGIVSVNAGGTILTANRTFEMMFGWAPGTLAGQPIRRPMPAFGVGAERQDGLHLVGVRKDGSEFPTEVSVNHVDTPSGRRTFAFVTDISARQRAAEALQTRTTELEYRTTQLRRMASELTLAEQHAREQIAKTLHDGLQQLLVIAALNLEHELKHDSARGAAPSERVSEAKHHLDEAISAARSLNLELFPPVLQRAGLPAALRWLARWIHDKYRLEVQIEVDPLADSGRKDVRTLLFESVRELLFNAVKHADTDRVALDLAVDAADQLSITVTDQGIGFDPAALDDRSKAGETGWGLFSIRERLTLLGGSFTIESAPGRGARIRLVAPRGTPQRVAPAAHVSPPPPIALPPPNPDGRASPDALRILIVDDHATVRIALREILHEQPELSVVGDASNGFEAIARAHALRPDVILMDVAMPLMDGIEATARIHAELPEIRVLGLSMHTKSETVDAIGQAGAANFFVKGIDTRRLIDHLLNVHASRGGGRVAVP